MTKDRKGASMTVGNSGKRLPQDVRHLTLGMDGAWDAYRKLDWEVRVFQQLADVKVPAHDDAYREIQFPMYAAINAASTAWSLIEWVWFEVEREPAQRSKFLVLAGASASDGLPQLKFGLRKAVPIIDACHQIAHAAKHAQLADVTPGMTAEISFGVWERAGWHYWTANGSLSFSQAGENLSIGDLLESIRSWWHGVLIGLSIPDRAKIASREGVR